MTFWLPLESNPEVLNKYIYKLGVSPKWNVVDIYGLEPDVLEWIVDPVKAVILLFPCSDAYENHRKEENEALKSEMSTFPEDMFYMKQCIHNACGTIALVHSIANNKEIDLSDGVLKSYLERTKNMSPQERGTILEADTAFTDVHQELALEGQTNAPNPEDKVNHHFIAFINHNGVLYELDGRKEFPIKHGQTSDETLLKDAAVVCKKFMARDPEEVRFTIIALTKLQE